MLIRPLSGFYGPVIPALDAINPVHYQTLTHWVESRKFDAQLHPAVVEDLLLMPGEHDARKFSKRHSASWRSDWPLIKASTIQLGVAYFCIDRVGAVFNQRPLVSELGRSGISESMALDLISRGHELAMGPRVCILAGSSVPASAINRRLRLVNKRFDGQWVLMHWRGRGSNMLVHDWALASGLPVLYTGVPDQRSSGPGAKDLRDAADFYWVFDQKSAKRAERTISELRSASKSVEVVYWQHDATNDLFAAEAP